MKRYNPKDLEPKWQKKWEADGIYRASDDMSKPKRYVLEYFPYPSGAAMHVGHVRNYTIGDAIARFNRMRGYNVLHPMGWDAFGLPAENYAIKNSVSPRVAIDENTSRFKQQLMQMGFSYDWSREIDSTDPNYYKWTQWFFLLLLKRGLAYQQESLQWWCPVDKTVLANEQVEAGKCWRCGNDVEKKALKQWFFKITDYADRLLNDLDDLNWSDAIKSMQRNWIGKSKGAEVDFKLDGSKETIRVFTTRPDTLFGATFMVLAPEHPLVEKITTLEQKQAVEDYKKQAQAKSDIERQETEREKTGVFTGAYAINPVNDEKIPVWIADYVLTGYGTGAIMAVPAHDQRDREFAKKFDLPIVEVVAPDFGIPLPNAVDVTGPVVIGYDPKTKRFMSLINKKNNMRWFAAGGLEDGESYEEAAYRELKEEAGYAKVQKLIQLGGPNYSYFYNSNKDSNRRSFSYMFLAIINEEDAEEQELESHEQYDVVWSDLDTIQKDLEKEPSGREHWLDGLQRTRDAVRAFEAGEAYDGPVIHDDGILFNSGVYDGMPSAEAREKIVADLAKKGVGEEKVNYKMRDWLISRQRYWGAPIPVIHCEKCGAVPVPEKDLPVQLPELEKFEPSGDGRSPLANVDEFVNTTCPKCDGKAERETDTMDGFACSSWYFLRFADPHNNGVAFDKEKAEFWLPVDDYIGGAEHAVMHLLYARFWTKVMQDEGLINFSEPFTTLRNQGMILAPDGQKMSKSKGNTIEPDGLIDQGYGADSIRIMELFIGPWNQSANWSVEGMGGSFRFLQRVWTLTQEYLEAESGNTESKALLTLTHKAIFKVSKDLEELGFNTAIAALMEYVNELYKLKAKEGFTAQNWQFAITALLQLLAPFAPHIAEELWEQVGQKGSVHTSEWPVHDDTYLQSDTMKIVVQVNGKVRATIEVSAGSDEATVTEAAKNDENVQQHLDGKQIKKTIYVPSKLVNFVV